MEIGDRVISYTHEASDGNHRTIDGLAIVTRIIDDHTVDVVEFPPGGPVTFARLSQFDPDNPGDAIGLDYWRPVGEEPPDFEHAFAYSNNPDWVALRARQRNELKAARDNAINVPFNEEEMLARQKADQDALRAKLDDATPKKEPVK